MKNRISIRGTVLPAAVVAVTTAVTGAVGLTAGWGAETEDVVPIRAEPAHAAAAIAFDDERLAARHAGRVAHEQKVKDRLARERAARKRAARERAAREAREAREAQEQRASRSRATYGGDPRGIAASIAADQYGWGADQFGCLDSLWTRESGWNVHASNPTSGAYGIPQALPGSKMGTYGSDWADNPTTQIEWGLAYIRDSYGTPCGAWSEFQSQGWY